MRNPIESTRPSMAALGLTLLVMGWQAPISTAQQAAAPAPAAAAAMPAQGSSVGTAAGYSANLGCSYEMLTYGSNFAMRLLAPPPAGSPLNQSQIQLEQGDTILALDDVPISGPAMLETHHSQTKVTFINWRTNQIEARWVTLPAQGAPPPPPAPPAPGRFILGVVGMPVLVNIGVPQRGLRITQVTPGSAAAAAGLSPGMTILTAGPYSMSDINSLRSAISNSGGTLPMTVLDAGGSYARSVTAYMGGGAAAYAPVAR